MAAFTEHFSENALHSICDESQTPALLDVVQRIKDELRPTCYTECVQDSDAEQEGVQPECILRRLVGTDEFAVPECVRDAGGAYQLDERGDFEQPLPESDFCFAYRTDAKGLTPDPLDDMGEGCIEPGYNLEFKIQRRHATSPTPGMVIVGSCVLSDFPQDDCPELN
jgi:hypothetical protein